MVFLNYSTMQMVAKIVYYGPGLCGKTTNLKEIYRKTSVKSRGEMVSLETETDRTLFFDLLPMDVGVIGGFKTKFQLYTVPGQVFYNSTRKLVLRGVDGIVFVADSQIPMLDANLDSYENLKENLEELGLNLNDVPLVFQFNKRDLPNIHSVEKLNAVLNGHHRPYIESSALKGIGVFETLKEISKQTLLKLRAKAVGNDLKKKETVALKVRGTAGLSDIKSELERESLAPPVEEEHTLVKSGSNKVSFENPPEDAIPENVSFDTYELEDDGMATDPGLVRVTSDTFSDDPDATDPSLGPSAESRAAAIASVQDSTLDDFELELPDEDLLSETDELDLTALKALKEQVQETPLEDPEEDLDFADEPQSLDDGLPDTPQEANDQPALLVLEAETEPIPPPPPILPNMGKITSFEDGPELQLDEEAPLRAELENTKPLPRKTMLPADTHPEDTFPNELVNVKTAPGKRSDLTSTLRELENLNLNVPRPKTTKISSSSSSVDDLLTGLVSSRSSNKAKSQKIKIKLPGEFKRAQLNCIFLDDRQNVIHTQLEKISAVESRPGKYLVKVMLEIEVDPQS